MNSRTALATLFIFSGYTETKAHLPLSRHPATNLTSGASACVSGTRWIALPGAYCQLRVAADKSGLISDE